MFGLRFPMNGHRCSFSQPDRGISTFSCEKEPKIKRWFSIKKACLNGPRRMNADRASTTTPKETSFGLCFIVDGFRPRKDTNVWLHERWYLDCHYRGPCGVSMDVDSLCLGALSMIGKHEYHIPGSVLSCSFCKAYRRNDREGKIKARTTIPKIHERTETEPKAIGPSLKEFIEGKRTEFKEWKTMKKVNLTRREWACVLYGIATGLWIGAISVLIILLFLRK